MNVSEEKLLAFEMPVTDEALQAALESGDPEMIELAFAYMQNPDEVVAMQEEIKALARLAGKTILSIVHKEPIGIVVINTADGDVIEVRAIGRSHQKIGISQVPTSS